MTETHAANWIEDSNGQHPFDSRRFICQYPGCKQLVIQHRALGWPPDDVAHVSPHLIVLLGDANSGKSTVADQLIKAHGYVEYTFAARLKAALVALQPIISWDHSTDEPLRITSLEDLERYKRGTPEVRRLLERFGTEAIRAQDNDFWVRPVVAEVKADPRPVVVSDCRFPNELEALDALGERRAVEVWRILRGSPAAVSHVSTLALRAVEADVVIVNDGTEPELRSKVSEIVDGPVEP